MEYYLLNNVKRSNITCFLFFYVNNSAYICITKTKQTNNN